jgi:DNA-nicking Smr family endonuclease
VRRRRPSPPSAEAPPLARGRQVVRSLGELRVLQRELQEAARQRAALEAQRREEQARQARERELFARTVGPVQALRSPSPEPPARPRPPAIARQRLQDEAAVLQEAVSDDFDVESLLDTDEGLSYRRFDIPPEVVKKLRRGVWALQAHLDLHGLRRDEAREALGQFLREAERQGLRCVRIVHGKGHGSPGREPVLKAKVKTWLAQRESVLAYTHARACDGGHGALVVLLGPSLPAAPHSPIPGGSGD